MNLEIGKTYKTRNGCSVIIEHDKGDPSYPFFGKVSINGGDFDRIAYFTQSGNYSRMKESGYDIIKEQE